MHAELLRVILVFIFDFGPSTPINVWDFSPKRTKRDKLEEVFVNNVGAYFSSGEVEAQISLDVGGVLSDSARFVSNPIDLGETKFDVEVVSDLTLALSAISDLHREEAEEFFDNYADEISRMRGD